MAGEHILIVDDEPAIRSTLRDVLEDEGYRVSAVGSGADALRFFADELPDLTFSTSGWTAWTASRPWPRSSARGPRRSSW